LWGRLSVCSRLSSRLDIKSGDRIPISRFTGRRVSTSHPVTYNEDVQNVASSEPLGQLEASRRARPLAFLDTNVIVGYLHGDLPSTQLFSAEAEGRIRFAVNAIVLQELLLTADAADRPEFEAIRDHLRILPVDFAKAEALLPRVKALRNRLAHSNDILILSSADECDFLVTRDARLKNLATAQRPQVVTPEELVVRLRAA
jgi:predicted nucleic acid-binding protein